MDRGHKDEARDFEKSFRHGKGIMPTPRRWIEHFWNHHRAKVMDLLRRHSEGAGSMIFVGIGMGDVLPDLCVEKKKVVGIDLNRTHLLHAAAHCNPLVADGAALPVKDGSMDLVVCNMVLHHIVGQGRLERALAECFRVLKKGGRLLIVEPNLFHPSGLALTALNLFHLYHIVGGGSNYEYALSPFRLMRICKKSFTSVEAGAVTFSHPRFPIALQELLKRREDMLARFYYLGFSFWLTAVKG